MPGSRTWGREGVSVQHHPPSPPAPLLLLSVSLLLELSGTSVPLSDVPLLFFFLTFFLLFFLVLSLASSPFAAGFFVAGGVPPDWPRLATASLSPLTPVFLAASSLPVSLCCGFLEPARGKHHLNPLYQLILV